MFALKVLILSRQFQIYGTRRLVEELSLRGHQALLWDPAWPVRRFAGEFDAVIPRLGEFRFEESLHCLESLLEKEPSSSRVVMNSPTSYRQARNKWSSYLRFLEMEIPTPFSELVRVDEDTQSFSLRPPCVIKDLQSSKGAGVFLARTSEDLRNLIQARANDFLIQEFFPESFGEDIRVFVVGQKIVACMKRKSTNGDFRSNLAQGGRGEPCTLTSAEEELALKAASALQLQIAGVDLLRTHKGSLILEANPCPGLEGIEKYTQSNVACAIIKHIEEVHEIHSSSGRTDTHF